MTMQGYATISPDAPARTGRMARLVMWNFDSFAPVD